MPSGYMLRGLEGHADDLHHLDEGLMANVARADVSHSVTTAKSSKNFAQHTPRNARSALSAAGAP